MRFPRKIGAVLAALLLSRVLLNGAHALEVLLHLCNRQRVIAALAAKRCVCSRPKQAQHDSESIS